MCRNPIHHFYLGILTQGSREDHCFPTATGSRPLYGTDAPGSCLRLVSRRLRNNTALRGNRTRPETDTRSKSCTFERRGVYDYAIPPLLSFTSPPSSSPSLLRLSRASKPHYDVPSASVSLHRDNEVDTPGQSRVSNNLVATDPTAELPVRLGAHKEPGKGGAHLQYQSDDDQNRSCSLETALRWVRTELARYRR